MLVLSPKMTTQIYAPNVHLFAFHSCDNFQENYILSKQEDYNVNLLWDKCNQEIFPKLNINKCLEVIHEPSGSRVDLLKGKTSKNNYLPLEGEVVYQNSPLRITGLAQPLRIHDSYALWLNIRRPLKEDSYKTEPLDLSILRLLNPDNCLLPSALNSSLGQTLVITGWVVNDNVNDKNLLRDLADNCVQAFLDVSPEKCPLRRQEGQLFGSHIFEYGLVSQGEDYCHIVVWLFCQGRTDEKLDKCYQPLIELYFYCSKVLQAFKNSRYIYNEELKKAYEDMEKEIYRFHALPDGQLLSKKDLDELKLQLKTLPKKALEYSRWLRYLQDSQLTITINTRNYIEKVRQIKAQLPNENLNFLETFSKKNCSHFQEQIKAYLGYCDHGLGLVDKMISSIRGIVEIDQAQRDRLRQGIEKEYQSW